MRAIKNWLALLLAITLVPGLSALSSRYGLGGRALQVALASSSGPNPVYLPLLTRNAQNLVQNPEPTPETLTILGVEASLAFKFSDMPQANTSWVRMNGVPWSSVETNRGDRNWHALSVYETEWQRIAEMGRNLVLVVNSTPEWAQKEPGSFCGPVKPEELPAFASFMHDLVVRYSAPPFSVKYWELWNEPDIDPSLVGNDSVFGCWGDDADPFYGGGYYAEMLKAVYPAIKAADPEAQVITGGLLLSCDPQIYGACQHYDGNLPPRFFEGILKNGGGPFFDGAAFHAYDIYKGQLGEYAVPSWGSSWNTTGPLVIKKAQYMKKLLNEYGLSDKYLVNTETAIIFYQNNCDEDCESSKAYYIPQLYAATFSEGIKTSIWFGLHFDWKHTSLFDENGNPLPAYTAFSVAWDKLGNAEYVQEIQVASGVKGFEFTRDGHRLWVLWSIDENNQRIVLPGTLVSATDVFGNPEPVQDNQMTVTLKPVYLEWQPVEGSGQ